MFVIDQCIIFSYKRARFPFLSIFLTCVFSSCAANVFTLQQITSSCDQGSVDHEIKLKVMEGNFVVVYLSVRCWQE